MRVLTHNFDKIHHETNWSNSGLGGLFYFILFLIWWHLLKILLIFNSPMCIPLILHLVGINRPWQDGWMTKQMWSIISSICLVIAGLWHVCHLFLLLFSSCRVCIPFFLRPVGVNKPWWDGCMTKRMDDGADGWNDVSWPNVF